MELFDWIRPSSFSSPSSSSPSSASSSQCRLLKLISPSYCFKMNYSLLVIFFIHIFISIVSGCGFPGSSSHANIKFAPENRDSGPYSAGTLAIYTCDNGYDLLGPSRRTCQDNGTWIPSGIPLCVLNVAVGKAAMQSSGQQGTAQRAVDGNTSDKHQTGSCTITTPEIAPWWYVNLLEPYLIQLVRIDFGRPCCGSDPAIVTVRIGNNRPDMGKNAVCNRFVGFVQPGAPLYLPCSRPIAGAFVSVHIESTRQRPIQLSICETFVYTDHALSIEQCPSFRDQPLGSTSTYNGKCYTFYNDKVETFDNAKRFCELRGGTLVDDTSPALQGFLSWELYRKHRNDPQGQYWLGAVRDQNNPKNWKWINGKDVTVSFWVTPRGSGNCSRMDGVRSWMWDATSCEGRLHFVCQLRPLTCGLPEIPTNSTILYRKLDIGAHIEYRCSPGTLLIGPNVRTCLETGFFSDNPPKCKYLECGFPASINNGDYSFTNGTRSFQSIVQYSCKEGYAIVGRSALSCDVDGRWNGPPPRCQAIECSKPIEIENGYVQLSGNQSIVGTRAIYTCRPDHDMEGDAVLVCGKNGFWEGTIPICRGKKINTLRTPPSSSTSSSSSSQSSSTSTTRSPTPSTRRYPSQQSPRYPPSVYTSNGSRRPPYNPSNSYPNDLLTTSSTARPPTTRTNIYTRLTAVTSGSGLNGGNGNGNGIASRRPSSSNPTLSPSSSVPSQPPSSSYPPSSSQPPISTTGVPPSSQSSPQYTRKTVSPTLTTSTRSRPHVVNTGEDDRDNEISDTMANRSNMKSSGATTKLNMGGIIALGVFGGFVFLAAITTIIVIIFRRLRNSRSSIDAQTISTFDSSGDQNGFYRNYKESWENLKYVRNSSYKPNALNRLDAFDPGFGHTARGQRACNEGFRDLNEITLNADVAALYSRPDKHERRHGRR